MNQTISVIVREVYSYPGKRWLVWEESFSASAHGVTLDGVGIGVNSGLNQIIRGNKLESPPPSRQPLRRCYSATVALCTPPPHVTGRPVYLSPRTIAIATTYTQYTLQPPLFCISPHRSSSQWSAQSHSMTAKRCLLSLGVTARAISTSHPSSQWMPEWLHSKLVSCISTQPRFVSLLFSCWAIHPSLLKPSPGDHIS